MSEKRIAVARHARWLGGLGALLTVIALVRIVSTYGVFSQTWDEPAHIAAGLEWLQRGTYTYEPQHPPLARVAVATGPYLAGVRLPEQPDPALADVPEPLRAQQRMWREGNQVLLADGSYTTNLALARVGALPFFILGALFLWLWTARLFDRETAVLALLFYTTSPNILAHAGLATTDMAATAMMLVWLFSFTLWLEGPTLARALWLGLASGAAVITKFSLVVFIPICGLVILLTRWILTGPSLKGEIRIESRWLRSGLVVLVCAFLVAWTAYRFSLRPLAGPAATATPGDERGLVTTVVRSVAELPVYPLTELVAGIEQVIEHQGAGHRSYLLGEVSESGWWYFYPVAVAVKTPVPLLILIAGGLVMVVLDGRRRRAWPMLVPPLCALAILGIMMISSVNIGLRHILPAYPLFFIVAARAAWRWLAMSSAAPRFLAVGLVTWHVVGSALAHPDYLAYFNVTAASEPQRYLIQGDLDWGQDLHRLDRKLDELHVEHVHVAYNGSAFPVRHLSQSVDILLPGKRATGWIAVSEWRLKNDGTVSPPWDGYAWLEAHTPVARVGKSIRLYRIDPTSENPEIDPPHRRSDGG